MNANKVIGFALGPVASAVFGLITVPVIAWAFSADDVGRMNMLQISVSLFMLVFVLGLDQAYVREFHESRDRARLLKACFVPGFVLLTFVGIGSITFSSKLSQLLFGTTDPVFLWVAFACVISTFVSKFLALILRMQERGLAYSASQVISKALLLILVVGLILFGLPRDFLHLELAFLVSVMAVVPIFLWNTSTQWRPAIAAKLAYKEMFSLLKFGFPLVFSGLAYWGLIATSSIALRSLSSLAELGIYSVTMSFAGVATIFQSVFSTVWGPVVYRWVAEGNAMTRLDDIARKALAVVCAFFILCGIFSWVLDYVLPAQYEQVKYLVMCGMVQPLLYTLSEVTGLGIGVTRRTILNIWVTLGAFLSNVLLSYLLVPTHGALGAVTANAIAFLVFFVVKTEVSAYVWRQLPRARIYAFVSLAVIFSVGTATLTETFHIQYAWIWLAALPVYIYSFRSELLKMAMIGYKTWRYRSGS